MLPKKQMILLGVTVVLCIASAVIIYQSFFSGPDEVEQVSSDVVAMALQKPVEQEGTEGGPIVPVPTSASGAQALLGGRLDFSQIKKYNPDGRVFNYPTVNPGEVGPALGDIFRKASP